MLTSKQRATLRGAANGIDTIFQVGKGGIGDELIIQTENALKARELIKMRVLETSEFSAREAAETLAEATGAEVIQVIGTKFILFKKKAKDSAFQDLLKK